MHIEYGRQLAEEFKYDLPFGGSALEFKRLYQLGCQGPDFLLYHRFMVKQGGCMVELGNLMHNEHCGPFLLSCFQQTLTLPPWQKDAALVYFLGFLTHHLLDRTLHPYVNWKAGYRGYNHQRFEIAMDTLVMHKLCNLHTWQVPVWKEVDAGSELPPFIVSILNHSAKTWYSAAAPSTPTSWQVAYRDMLLAHKILFDPAGWKNRLSLGYASSFFSKAISAEELQLDYLNEQHKPWRHSAAYTEVSTDSVWDLWDQAIMEGRLVLHALTEWLAADEENAEYKQFIFTHILGNRSYDTGKDCKDQLRNLYAEPIWSVGS
nr:zinc dependent phospholipase C family protein [Paenibacillus shirakamiensis]